MDEEVPEFSSIEAECAFWKSRARELKTELDEFTEDSHQLEKELEITIKLKEDQLTDLRHKYQRQQHEIDSLMAKLKQSENESLQWEQRYKKEKAEGEVLRKHTRELEQKNDDLERAHRIVSESVTEFERMLNREYEKNVMLEVEYEMEKENSQIQLQRLMDEARDLKQELKIQQKQPGTVRKDDDDGTGDEDKNHNKPGDTTKRRRAESTGSQVDNKEADEAVKRLSNDTEVEKAELEKGASERRSSVKMDSDKATTNGIGNGLCNEQSSDVPAPATAAQQTSSVAGSRATASMHRQNSLKQMERLKHGNSMTASSRSTALAIVADLLRRVNNIDATLKELKRPKSLDDDLADEDDGTTTIHSTRSEKAKSPSLIC